MPPSLRLAIDQNFPLSLVTRVADFLPAELELSPLTGIHPALSTLDDRPLLIALKQLGWNGLITNNYKMLFVPQEIATIVATRSIVVAVQGLGHDPLRAAGALLLELPRLERRLVRDEASVFLLRYGQRPARPGWDFLADTARRRNQSADELWHQHRPSEAELSEPVL